MDSTGPSEGIVAVYADAENEDSQTLRIDRMLILRGDGPPLVLLGPPVRHVVDTSDEMQIKYVLAMTASQGKSEVLMGISPDAIFVKNQTEFDAVLRKYNCGMATPEVSVH